MSDREARRSWIRQRSYCVRSLINIKRTGIVCCACSFFITFIGITRMSRVAKSPVEALPNGTSVTFERSAG